MHTNTHTRTHTRFAKKNTYLLRREGLGKKLLLNRLKCESFNIFIKDFIFVVLCVVAIVMYSACFSNSGTLLPPSSCVVHFGYNIFVKCVQSFLPLRISQKKCKRMCACERVCIQKTLVLGEILIYLLKVASLNHTIRWHFTSLFICFFHFLHTQPQCSFLFCLTASSLVLLLLLIFFFSLSYACKIKKNFTLVISCFYVFKKICMMKYPLTTF